MTHSDYYHMKKEINRLTKLVKQKDQEYDELEKELVDYQNKYNKTHFDILKNSLNKAKTQLYLKPILEKRHNEPLLAPNIIKYYYDPVYERVFMNVNVFYFTNVSKKHILDNLNDTLSTNTDKVQILGKYAGLLFSSCPLNFKNKDLIV